MLTAAGVAAPDGNELWAFQTGLWGAFLQALQRRQPEGLDHAWVSFFTYEPMVGAAIFAEWVQALPNLHWIAGKVPKGVMRQGDRILGVHFDDLTVQAQVTLDGTELGDLLALGEVPYRWGWEDRAQFSEPSAPQSLTAPNDPLCPIIKQYPVQSPTWVVLLQDRGAGHAYSTIEPSAAYDPQMFQGAWEGYGPAAFLNYGRLPRQQFMLNWPHQGNDYGVGLERLVQGEAARQAWTEAAIAHSHNFAHYIQSELGQRYGLATEAFPKIAGQPGGGALALMPYYRESRRLVGVTTVTERDILPLSQGTVAALPVNAKGEMSAIAIGNYPNDHHYTGFDLPLAPKALRWGGRWTGTPFALPYEALIPAAVEGLLVCDKNLSVSHIANGATRLQPVVLGLGQAAGMAAALCVEQQCEPRELAVRELQTALLHDPQAPAAIVPLFDRPPSDPQWRSRQQYYRATPEAYPSSGHDQRGPAPTWLSPRAMPPQIVEVRGWLQLIQGGPNWQAQLQLSTDYHLDLVTLNPLIHDYLQTLQQNRQITVKGLINRNAGWIQVWEINRD
jgi:hypothetical protein